MAKKKNVAAQKDLQTRLEARTSRFVSYVIGTEAHNYRIRDIRKMLVEDETTSLAYESLCLLITTMIGAYTHDAKPVIDCVEESLKTMQGTIKQKWLDACTMLPYGFVYGERVHRIVDSKAVLTHLTFLRQDLLDFDDKTPTEYVTYNGDETEKLEYRHGFHLMNQANISPGYNPYGHRLGDRALRHWDLYNIGLASYAVVAQKQATKLLVGKTDTSAEVDTGEVDPQTAEPITVEAGQTMLAALEKAENSSVLVIDTDDEVEVVDQSHDGEFFLNLFHHTDEKRFRAFYHPISYMGSAKNGMGDSSLAESQQTNLINIAASKAEYITGEFVEQVLRPIIDFNLGEQDNYGHFEINTKDPRALETAKVIVSALDKLDQRAKERLEGLLGIE